ncbi:MAG TPA: trehalase-like domain-containing protein, partial [Reyranella sp.]
MPSRIEDYALIGDCETAALVARDGSLDWMCWPRLDSDACFAALLGAPEHGRWRLAPFGHCRGITRRYLGDTLILETRFETDQGVAKLIDFMPPRSGHSDVVRMVVGESGNVAMHMQLAVRFGYGSRVPWIHRQEDDTLRIIAGADQVVLRSAAPVSVADNCIESDFAVAAGETVAFTLTYAASHLVPPDPIDPAGAFATTKHFWEGWSAKAS